MNWASVTNLENWKDFAREIAWRLTPGESVPALPPSWPLDGQKLAALSVVWPSAYQWPPASTWMDSILTGLRHFVPVQFAPLPQTYPTAVRVQVRISGVTHEVAIDYSDLMTIDEECAGRVALYFKMQCAREGYRLPNVVPGGFVPYHHDLYRYLSRLRHIRDHRPAWYDVYGRFGMEFAGEIRQEAHTLLSRQNTFRYEGGLRRLRYSRFLNEVAHSKICIDLPGKGDFCFRLVDYLAVGACIIGPRHHTTLHMDLKDREHMVYAADDLSDLVDLCRYYLQHDREREEICRNSRLFFDRYLHRRQMGAYYLSRCLQHLPFPPLAAGGGSGVAEVAKGRLE